jgi:hypothetical protein
VSAVRAGAAVVGSALALTLGLALAGCSHLDRHGAGAPASTPAAIPTPAATTGAGSADLDGLQQDLDAASTADQQADGNAQSADQAAATGDEP